MNENIPNRKPRNGPPFRNQGSNLNKSAKDHYDIQNRLRDIQGPLIDLPPVKKTTFLNRYRLFVGNLPNDLTQDEFLALFTPYGKVVDAYIDPSKKFAFITFDYYHNALKAKYELQGTQLKDRKLFINFSPKASIRVKNLSVYVTNELLEIAFSIFGEVEGCYIVTDAHGKSIGEGVVDFKKKSCALVAKNYCTENMFFVTQSPKPVIIEDYKAPEDDYGVSEASIKKNKIYYKDREIGPRFALPDTFEQEYGKHFVSLRVHFEEEVQKLKEQLIRDERKLVDDMRQLRYDYETANLKEIVRQREIERDMGMMNYGTSDNYFPGPNNPWGPPPSEVWNNDFDMSEEPDLPPMNGRRRNFRPHRRFPDGPGGKRQRFNT